MPELVCSHLHCEQGEGKISAGSSRADLVGVHLYGYLIHCSGVVTNTHAAGIRVIVAGSGSVRCRRVLCPAKNIRRKVIVIGDHNVVVGSYWLNGKSVT